MRRILEDQGCPSGECIWMAPDGKPTLDTPCRCVTRDVGDAPTDGERLAAMNHIRQGVAAMRDKIVVARSLIRSQASTISSYESTIEILKDHIDELSDD